MTSAQLDPSAQAPCTSTTLRAWTCAGVWARTSKWPSAPESAATVSARTTRVIFIEPTPYLKFLSGSVAPIGDFRPTQPQRYGGHVTVRAGLWMSGTGARAKREPGIHNHDREYGFRACQVAHPGMTR